MAAACSSLAGQDYRPAAGLCQQLPHYGDALRRRLAGPVDGLGKPLAQGAVVVDAGKTEIGIRQPS